MGAKNEPNQETGSRHLVHVFPTFGVGGVQNRIIRVANALGPRFRHTFVAMDGNFQAAGTLDPTLPFQCEHITLRKSGLPSLSNFVRARAAIRRLRPDMLLTYNWGASEWAMGDRFPVLCPHIHFESGFGPDETPQRQHWRRILARRLLLSNCRYIVVPSATLYSVATRVWRFPRDRVRLIPNGVDCRRFMNSPTESDKDATDIAQNGPVVGTVAALRPEKNLLRLLRAFASIDGFESTRLMIVGDGPERATLQAAAASLGIVDRVVFAGHVSDPAPYLRRFDVFALSSDTEQMPNSVLEAMASRLAVAATDVGDTKQMLAEENAAFVVPPDNEPALAGAIASLLRDRDLARRIGEANRARVQTRFSLEAMVKSYEELYSVC